MVLLLSAVPVRWKESTVVAPAAPLPEVVPAPLHWLPRVIVWLLTTMLKLDGAVGGRKLALQPHMKMSFSALELSKVATQPWRLFGTLLHAIELPK